MVTFYCLNWYKIILYVCIQVTNQLLQNYKQKWRNTGVGTSPHSIFKHLQEGKNLLKSSNFAINCQQAMGHKYYETHLPIKYLAYLDIAGDIKNTFLDKS